jgi:hypothetical protein
MLESTLYIVTGIAFYGGSHQLYLGARQPPHQLHVLHGVMYFLLAGFALASALTQQPQAPTSLVSAGKLTITMGILLWGTLAWFVAACTQHKARLLLTILSAAWTLHLIANIGSPLSLLYTEMTPSGQPLSAGAMPSAWPAGFNPWWGALQVTLLFTLVYSMYATIRQFMAGNKGFAGGLMGGLLVLSATSLSDLLVGLGMLQFAYLTPFGFLVLLLASGGYQVKQTTPKHKPEPGPAASYNLTFHLNQQHKAPPDLAGSVPTAEGPAAVEIEQRPQANLPHKETAPPITLIREQQVEAVPAEQAGIVVEGRPTEAGGGSGDEEPGPRQPVVAEQAAPKVDQADLEHISDSLVDIIVYATMAIRRFERGNDDREALEVLFRKIRAKAMKAHRRARHLTGPDRTDESADSRLTD